MEWWQIILITAIVVIIGAASEVYVRLSPQRELRKQERHKAQKAIKSGLESEINTKAKTYRSVGFW